MFKKLQTQGVKTLFDGGACLNLISPTSPHRREKKVSIKIKQKEMMQKGYIPVRSSV